MVKYSFIYMYSVVSQQSEFVHVYAGEFLISHTVQWWLLDHAGILPVTTITNMDPFLGVVKYEGCFLMSLNEVICLAVNEASFEGKCMKPFCKMVSQT